MDDNNFKKNFNIVVEELKDCTTKIEENLKEYYKVEYDEGLARIKISEIKEFNIDNDFFVHPFNSLEDVIKDLKKCR